VRQVEHLQKHFGKHLLFVFRIFPMSQMHTHAESATGTAEFACAHDKFWEMHDLLFENQDRMEDSLFVELTQELHLCGQAIQFIRRRDE
jgi:protein-disulfide isomerase